MVIHMDRPWKRFLLILILAMSALLRVESVTAHMQGGLRGPSRILRVEPVPDGVHLYVTGWMFPLTRSSLTALEAQVKAWRLDRPDSLR
jgi:hypothetical protein